MRPLSRDRPRGCVVLHCPPPSPLPEHWFAPLLSASIVQAARLSTTLGTRISVHSHASRSAQVHHMHAGIVAGMLGGKVCATDLEGNLPLLKQNISANGVLTISPCIRISFPHVVVPSGAHCRISFMGETLTHCGGEGGGRLLLVPCTLKLWQVVHNCAGTQCMWAACRAGWARSG